MYTTDYCDSDSQYNMMLLNIKMVHEALRHERPPHPLATLAVRKFSQQAESQWRTHSMLDAFERACRLHIDGWGPLEITLRRHILSYRSVPVEQRGSQHQRLRDMAEKAPRWTDVIESACTVEYHSASVDENGDETPSSIESKYKTPEVHVARGVSIGREGSRRRGGRCGIEGGCGAGL